MPSFLSATLSHFAVRSQPISYHKIVHTYDVSVGGEPLPANETQNESLNINFHGKVMKAPLMDILTRIRRKTRKLGAIFLLWNLVSFLIISRKLSSC
ncbi:hypothetical protein AB4Z22_31545, partial [Paenibacillus sp. TAF58]